LARELTARQLSMMALGGAIGTGLFLGSSLAVRLAGPGIIVTYLLGALVALLLMSALSEMAVAHPTAGSFGVYAEIYVSRWAGFAVRYTYWTVQSIAIGGEATAVAIYCQWWFPGTPAWAWIMFFSALLIYVNTRAVGSFGEFEYWFSLITSLAGSDGDDLCTDVAVNHEDLAGSHPTIPLHFAPRARVDAGHPADHVVGRRDAQYPEDWTALAGLCLSRLRDLGTKNFQSPIRDTILGFVLKSRSSGENGRRATWLPQTL
jgi:Amino acid permease